MLNKQTNKYKYKTKNQQKKENLLNTKVKHNNNEVNNGRKVDKFTENECYVDMKTKTLTINFYSQLHQAAQ